MVQPWTGFDLFSDGKQYVLLDDQKSTEMSLEFGVPQGSVLGPVLFILYTTPFTCLIEKHSLRHEMFADDTQLNHSESPENYSDLVRSLQDQKYWAMGERKQTPTE